MKKSRLEILRGKLARMGETRPIRDDMPEDVAESFIAELRFCPDCGAAAAVNWSPQFRNEEPWIKEMLDSARTRAGAILPPDLMTNGKMIVN